MDEDQILPKSTDSEPLTNDPITPGGVMEAASESQKVDNPDTMPSNIVVSADSAETDEDAQVKVESGDHSTKSGIDQVKTTLEKKDEPAPVINVNVEAPVKVIKSEPSDRENITNLNVTNVYPVVGSDETKTDSDKVSELTPNLITSDQSSREEIRQSTPIRVETEPIVNCKEYWKNKGVKFGKPNSPEIFYDEKGDFRYEFGFSSSKLLNGTPFIAEYADIIGTQMGAFNQLYGRFMLKGGKWSNSTQSIIYMKINE